MIEDTFDFATEAIVGAFGEDVEYRAGSWALAHTIPAVFGSGFQRVQNGEIRVASRRPEITIRLADLTGVDSEVDAEPAAGDEVEVRGVAYTVATVQSDVEVVSATLVLKAT